MTGIPSPSTRTVLTDPVHCLAFGFGAGLAPWMPGTAGTLVAVLFYLVIQPLPLWAYLCLTLAVILAGFWICGASARRLGVHDHPGIVWDEFAGFLVTMIAAPAGWPWIVAGFVLFRLCDIFKPWPARWLDRHLHSGAGIVLDDVVAGIYGMILLQMLAWWLA